jgi:hypothetical protein
MTHHDYPSRRSALYGHTLLSSGLRSFRSAVLLFFLLFPVVLHAGPVPVLQQVYILEDPAGTLRFRDVSAGARASRFDSTIDGKNTLLTRPSSAYWLRFRVRPHDGQRLAFRAGFLYSDVQLYIPLAGGNYLLRRSGLHRPFRERAVRTGQVVIPLPYGTRADAFYYLRLEVPVPLGLDVGIQPYDDLVNGALERQAGHVFFFGIIFIISAYNLILYGVLRQKAYLFYGLYVFSLGLFAVVDWGYLKQLYPADRLVWHKVFWSIPFGGMTVFLLLYCQSLLHTRRHLPRLHRLIGGLIGVRLLLLAVSAGIGPAFRHEVPVNNAVLLLDNAVLLVAFAAGVARWRRGFRPARYFLVGLALVFAGYLIHTLYVFNVFLPGAELYFYAATLAEAVCFSLALAHRFRAAEKARVQAQHKVIEGLRAKKALKEKLNGELERLNGELEEKVLLRTRQIERQAAEIARINQLLQEHNKKLEGQVVDISTARVMQKSVTFEEFGRIYPDEEACLRFLDELKWGNGFSCRRCGHPGYTRMKKPYTRRCTGCRYPESVISFTLFGKLKFPIVKAFYMTFLISSGKDVTVDELSELVSLRRQTCWAFKRKVKEIMLSRKHLKKPSDGWSHLVLNVEEAVSE